MNTAQKGMVAALLLAAGACGSSTGGGPDAAGAEAGVDGAPINGTADGAAPSDGGAGAGAWTSLPPLGRGPRQETAVVALDGKLYVIGGFDAAPQVVADVEVFDPGRAVWASVAPLPAALHHANAAAVNGKIYVVGALRSSFIQVGTALAYDPLANAWTPRTSMPSGTERGASAVAVVGSKIYVAGGLRGGAVSMFSAYDTASDTWEDLPALPAPTDHLVAGAVGTTVYVVGGRNTAITSHTASVSAYDTVARTWSPRAAMPTSRGGAAAAIVSGRLLVAGGEGNADRTSGVFDQVESYDPTGDRWTALSPMKTPRHGTGAAEIGGKMYVPGGADKQAFGAVATVEVLTP